MARPRTPLLAVDAVVADRRRRILLIRRKNAPFKGQLALPGGFVDIGESTQDACRRELVEETGVAVRKLTLVGVYSDPDRDPRGHTVAIAYLARVATATPQAGDDAAAAEWVQDWAGEPLAFDHARIIADAMRLIRAAR